ncbi:MULTISPECIES: hypothetical protein [unclassified Sphingomonas]|nr:MULTISPECIES: hypothetical protein [unclassified Sphingomonas]MBN8813452.1 hypothetical protein [Sphingomonas sp.]
MTVQPNLFPRKPTHRLYRVTGEGQSAIWTRIGAAWLTCSPKLLQS